MTGPGGYAERGGTFNLIVGAAIMVVPAIVFSLVSSESFRYPKLWSGEFLVGLAGLAGLFLGGGGDRVVIAMSLPLWGALLSTVNTTHPLTSAGELARLASLWVLLAVLRRGGRAPSLLPFILLAAAINGLMAIAQMAGWRASWWVVWEERHAIFGTFGNPNFMAEYLAPIIVLGIGAAFGTIRGSSRILLYASLIIAGTSLVKTVSRSGLLGIVSGLIVFALIAGPTILEGVKKKGQVIAAMAVSAALILAFEVRPLIGRMSSSLHGNDPTVSTRLFMWKTAASMLGDHPVLGTGPGGYGLNYLEYAARLQESGATRPTYAGITQDAHNDWLQLLADRGLLGAVLLFGVLGLMSASSLRDLRFLGKGERLDRAASLGALAAIGVEAFFGFPMRIFPTAALAVYLLARVVPTRPVGPGPARFARAATVAWSVAVLLLAGRSFLADAYLKAGNGSPQAGAWYARGLALLPSHGELHFRAGLFYSGAGKTAEAEREFTAALPGFKDPDVWFNLGALAKKEGRYGEAAEKFKAGLRLYPFYKAVAYVDLAESALAAGRKDEARGAAEAALAIEPGNPRAAAVMRKLGRGSPTRK